jgi:hypothetical protein
VDLNDTQLYKLGNPEHYAENPTGAEGISGRLMMALDRSIAITGESHVQVFSFYL